MLIGEYFVILAGHDHVAFATFDTGIQCVFLVTAQPAEITAVGTVLIGTRHDKAQEFVPVIPFGNHSKTCSVRPRNPFGFTKVPVSTLPLM